MACLEHTRREGQPARSRALPSRGIWPSMAQTDRQLLLPASAVSWGPVTAHHPYWEDSTMSFNSSLKSAWTGRSMMAAWAVVFLTGSLPAFGEEGLQISSDRSVVSVKAGQQPVLVYQYSERPRKPYLKELFSPGGVNVLRDAPADHLHHHGLMFAVAVDGVDFWSENEKCGRQRHVGPGVRGGVPGATFTQQVDWMGPDGQTLLLRERRTIEVGRMPEAGPTLLRWRSRLEVPSGKPSVTLSGSPYFGLGMRFVQSRWTWGERSETPTGRRASRAPTTSEAPGAPTRRPPTQSRSPSPCSIAPKTPDVRPRGSRWIRRSPTSRRRWVCKKSRW